MKKTVVRNGSIFEYTVKSVGSSRTIKLTVHHTGEVIVSASKKITETAVEDFVMSKADWILRSIIRFKKKPRTEVHTNELYDWTHYKKIAHDRVCERLIHFNQFYGFTWNTVSVKKAKSRWGSCSSKRNLNFNYKIALLPPELADYIIVHELCHLGEMNHSANFWNLVKRTIPNYKELRNQLKTLI